jgi:hypothetical protein
MTVVCTGQQVNGIDPESVDVDPIATPQLDPGSGAANCEYAAQRWFVIVW